jgi:hypothetical protein
MSGGTDNPAYGRLGTFFVQRSARHADAPWSHGAKVLLWAGLAVASWAVVIVAGYFVWAAL